jgi:hypothetical protein
MGRSQVGILSGKPWPSYNGNKGGPPSPSVPDLFEGGRHGGYFTTDFQGKPGGVCSGFPKALSRFCPTSDTP